MNAPQRPTTVCQTISDCTFTKRFKPCKVPANAPRFIVFDPSIPTFERILFYVKALAALGHSEECLLNSREVNRQHSSIRRRPRNQKILFSSATNQLIEGITDTKDHRNDKIPRLVASSSVGVSVKQQLQQQQQQLMNSVSSNMDSIPPFLSFSHYCELRVITDPHHPAFGQYGLFAKEAIPPQTALVPYSGIVQYCNANPGSRCYVMSHAHSSTLEIDGEFVGNYARFANDPRGVPSYLTSKAANYSEDGGLVDKFFHPISSGNGVRGGSSNGNTDDGDIDSPLSLEAAIPKSTYSAKGASRSYAQRLPSFPTAANNSATKHVPNIVAEVKISRFGEYYTVLSSSTRIAAGQELLLDYGAGHRFRTQRWTNESDGSRLAKPRQNAFLPCPLVPTSISTGTRSKVQNKGDNAASQIGQKRDRDDQANVQTSIVSDAPESTATATATTDSPPGLRLFWQCAHCGHHTHCDPHPTFVLLCEYCEVPRAANVALVIPYTCKSTKGGKKDKGSCEEASKATATKEVNNNDESVTCYVVNPQPTMSSSPTTQPVQNNAPKMTTTKAPFDRISNASLRTLAPSSTGNRKSPSSSATSSAAFTDFGPSSNLKDENPTIASCGAMAITNPTVANNPNHWGARGQPTQVTNAVVPQWVLRDARFHNVLSIPTPFPLNFTLISWHVYDDRIPISEVKCAAPPGQQYIQVLEYAEDLLVVEVEVEVEAHTDPATASTTKSSTVTRRRIGIETGVRDNASLQSMDTPTVQNLTSPTFSSSGEKIQWAPGEEVGAVGGVVLFANDSRIVSRTTCPEVPSKSFSSQNPHTKLPAEVRSLTLQRSFFCIPLPHTHGVPGGLVDDEQGIGDNEAMVMLPLNEFAHVGIVPSQSKSQILSVDGENNNETRSSPSPNSNSSLPFYNSAVVGNPKLRPNVTFQVSMDHLGCVFVAVIALEGIAASTELLVSEDDVILLY